MTWYLPGSAADHVPNAAGAAGRTSSGLRQTIQSSSAGRSVVQLDAAVSELCVLLCPRFSPKRCHLPKDLIYR